MIKFFVCFTYGALLSTLCLLFFNQNWGILDRALSATDLYIIFFGSAILFGYLYDDFKNSEEAKK